MCGRYSLICIDDLGNRFRVHNPMIGARSKFNVAPASEMPVIVRKENDEIALMRWGLVPRWAKEPGRAPRPINARAEGIWEKPMFAPLVKSRRCLVPASGFFEWKKEGKRNVPFYFHLPDEPLFAFAGMYDTWNGPDSTPLLTYTIITCEPNALVAGVHDRMPVILTRENEERWLAPAPLPRDEISRILVPYPAPAMEKVVVSDRVNNPEADDEGLIRPLFGLT
jgi:putative SOS response-associated peptidase YedK